MPAQMTAENLYLALWGFASARVITVAAKAGLLQALAGRPLSPAEAAAELALEPVATGKVLRALCAQGVLEAEGERFRVVPALCRSFIPGDEDLTPFVLHSHALYDRWGATLEDWLKGVAVARKQRVGPEAQRFGEAMVAGARLLAPGIARAIGLRGVKRVLDLGGGLGGYAVAFCREEPGLQVTVLDVPEVAALGPAWVEKQGLAGRVRFQAGDYHTAPLDGGYDLVLLANVLHIEPSGAAEAVIARAALALAPGGRMALVDFRIDDQKREDLMGCLFAINMRSHGDVHSEVQLRAWMERAGVRGIQRSDPGAGHWLLVGRRE
jgi:SAM-dependent methyltransferase